MEVHAGEDEVDRSDFDREALRLPKLALQSLGARELLLQYVEHRLRLIDREDAQAPSD